MNSKKYVNYFKYWIEKKKKCKSCSAHKLWNIFHEMDSVVLELDECLYVEMYIDAFIQ